MTRVVTTRVLPLPGPARINKRTVDVRNRLALRRIQVAKEIIHGDVSGTVQSVRWETNGTGRSKQPHSTNCPSIIAPDAAAVRTAC